MRRAELETLVRVNQAEIYRYLRYLGADRAEAEDLIQETFLAAYAKPRLPEPCGTPACAAWLSGIARNLFLMHCRKERTEQAAGGGIHDGGEGNVSGCGSFGLDLAIPLAFLWTLHLLRRDKRLRR